MNSDDIQKFLDTKTVAKGQQMKIDFKKRDSILGHLVQANDFKELKSKNLWRIVREKDQAAWNKSRNIDLAKIFNGSDFVKLSVITP